jgi:putative ABC transport system substrate-binding protein
MLSHPNLAWEAGMTASWAGTIILLRSPSLPMRRSEFLTLLAGAALVRPHLVVAQTTDRVRRIGILIGQAKGDPLAQALLASFREGLQERGWTEGRNAGFEIRSVEGRPDRAPALAAELVRSNVDVIVTSGTELTKAAAKASGGTPIVMVGVGDPIGAGIVASLARPGGNVTGLSLIAPELAAKRLELAKEALPDLARIAILWNPNNPSVRLRFRETEAAARVVGLKLESIEARQAGDFEKGLQAAARAGAQALITTEDALMSAHRADIIRLAMRHRLPAISGLWWFAEAGSLLSYGPSTLDLWRRAAGYVDRIFAGAKPADLPVEQPTKLELIVNLKTAKVLGVTIPPTVLARADRIIQ